MERGEINMKIGVSGHQKLGSPDDVAWIRTSMRRELEEIDFCAGITSLAAGADQLFAEVVLELGRSIDVVIPCGKYESTFADAAAAKTFEILKRRASHCYRLPFPSPSEKAFYEAGKRVVDMSDRIVAIWNGKPAAGLGGTADVVKYALKAGKSVLHLHTELKTTELL
jgi:hypothetical protein